MVEPDGGLLLSPAADTVCICRNSGCKCVFVEWVGGRSYQCLCGGHSTAAQTLMAFFFAKNLVQVRLFSMNTPAME